MEIVEIGLEIVDLDTKLLSSHRTMPWTLTIILTFRLERVIQYNDSTKLGLVPSEICT